MFRRLGDEERLFRENRPAKIRGALAEIVRIENSKKQEYANSSDKSK
jgi:hypothetical protein